MPKKEESNINVIEELNIQVLQDTIKSLEETKLKLLLTIKELGLKGSSNNPNFFSHSI
jgi:hypothetical protein